MTLHALRLRAAAYKRLLGGGARRTHEDCIRDMNTDRIGWLVTMRGNALFLEAQERRTFDRKKEAGRR